MHFTVYFLLIFNSPLFISADPNPPPLTAADISRIVKKGSSIITDSKWNRHTLLLLEGGKLGENNNVIAWKGKYNGETVAVKIVWDRESFDDEVEIYQALGSMNNIKIEDEGIPRVYFHGKVLSKYFAIAMTLFDGTLLDRYDIQNEHLSNLTILLIFRRLIEILKFLRSKRVVHNDIKPQNLFLRGSDVFIGDFDVATLNGNQNEYGTALYASKNFWHEKNRTAMDDLESLLFTMWSVAGVPVGGPNGKYPEGRAYLDHYLEYTEDAYMMEKLNYFTDEDVKKAFKFVHDEVISWGDNPYYDDLLREFDIAITNVRMKTGQIDFEWLKNGSTSRSDMQKITQRRLKETSNIKATRVASPRVTKNEFSGLLAPIPDRPVNAKKPPRLSRFARIDESTTHIFPECKPKCFNNMKLKERISSKILEKKLDFQLMKSKFKKSIKLN